MTISSLSNYVTYTFYVTATNTIGTSANSNSLTEYTDVPCPGGTFINSFTVSGNSYPAFGGATCTYNRYCDGDGGIGQAFAGGDCNIAGGVYCAGCT